MSAKTVTAILALAVSSASAATVGVVYTRITHSTYAEFTVPEDETASSQKPAKTAVVLNASESFLGSFAESSTDSDVPTCSAVSESQHCSGASSKPDVRMNILGSTRTILPIWLGGNSEDAYAFGGDANSWPTLEPPPSVEFVVQIPVHRGRTFGNVLEVLADTQTHQPQSSSGQSGNQGQTDSQTSSDSGETKLAYQVLNVPVSEEAAPLPHALDEALKFDPLAGTDKAAENSPLDLFAPQEIPTTPGSSGGGGFPELSLPMASMFPASSGSGPLGRGAGTAPEPSTLAMTILGVAALGLFRRRSILAAFKAATFKTATG